MTTGADVATGAIAPKAVPAVPKGAHVMARLVHDYVRGQWLLLVLAMLLMAATAGMSTALAAMLDPTINLLFIKKDPTALLIVPAVAFGVLLLRAACMYGQQVLIDSLGERVVTQAQRDMFGSLVKDDLARLNAVHSAQFVSNFIYDATLLRDAITRGVAAATLELLTLVGLTIVMIYEDWKLMVIAAIVAPLVSWALSRLGGSLRRASTRTMEETALLTTALSEALDGRRVVKAYGLEAHVEERIGGQLSARLRFLLKAVRRRAAAMPLADVFMGVIVALTLYYAGYQVIHRELELNQLVAFIGAMMLALQPVRNLSQVSTFTSTGLAAAVRVFGLIDSRPTVVDRPGAAPLQVTPGGGRVSLERVSFAYSSDASDAAV
ncbi:MAG: hypothetical protein JO348_02095, partial [Alphaproteobacteria bacterium]|nr:hypothetical protein [Alphaproteobacteria bacterium]